jgi:beta-galactosidase
VVGHEWAAGRAEVRVGYAQLLAGAGERLLTEVGSGRPCGAEVTAGAGRAVVIATDYPCHLDFWRAALDRLGVRPRLRHDADDPGLLLTSTVDRSGQRLLHLVNVAPSAIEFGLWHRDKPVLAGPRQRKGAPPGLMLPARTGHAAGEQLRTGSPEWLGGAAPADPDRGCRDLRYRPAGTRGPG